MKHNKKMRWWKILLLMSLGIIGFLGLCLFVFINHFILGYPHNEFGLRKAVLEHYALQSQNTDESRREIYKKYLASSITGSKSEDAYISETQGFLQSLGIAGWRNELHDVYVDGTDGYADRTVYDCADAACTDIKSQSRAFRKYVYEKGIWKMTGDEELLCPRKQPYEMAPEFLRAIDLISQRLTDTNNFQYVKNCLYVTYAENDDEINGAEGVFSFNPGQSQLQLNIKLSPRYKLQDDNMTAFLLAHEGEHAANYGIGLLRGYPMECFEDEGRAFNAQYWFLQRLKPEEKDSLINRINNENSPEVRSVLTTFMLIQNQYGSDFIEKATNVVKANPFYQEQCRMNEEN